MVNVLAGRGPAGRDTSLSTYCFELNPFSTSYFIHVCATVPDARYAPYGHNVPSMLYQRGHHVQLARQHSGSVLPAYTPRGPAHCGLVGGHGGLRATLSTPTPHAIDATQHVPFWNHFIVLEGSRNELTHLPDQLSHVLTFQLGPGLVAEVRAIVG